MLNNEFERASLRKAYSRAVGEDRDSINPDGYYYTSRGSDSYDLLLPHHNGTSFLETLRSKIIQSDSPIDILDVGCGQGRALAELLRDFPGRIRVSGIAATDLRQHAPKELQLYMEHIDLRVGDAHFLNEIFAQEKFDLIISVKTFDHLEYPAHVAQQCIELLKPQGLAFIEGYKYDTVLPQLQRRSVA